MNAWPKPGRYRHWKGDVYDVIGVAAHSETGDELVVYRRIEPTVTGRIWVRPLAMFCETVETDDGPVPRFAPAGDIRDGTGRWLVGQQCVARNAVNRRRCWLDGYERDDGRVWCGRHWRNPDRVVWREGQE